MTAVTVQYRDAGSWLDFTETKDSTKRAQKTSTVEGQIMIFELLFFHLKL